MAVVCRTGDGDHDFPAGMPILAVGHNPTCLKVLTGRLRSCKYHVTPVNETNEAMRLLRDKKDKFALVIIDVDMPDMDAFKLLEYLGKETDLPFIILSSCNDIERVKNGIDHGACDHLSKPVPMEQLTNIWHHVFRRNRLDRNKESTSTSSNKTRHRHEEDVECNINPCKRKQEATETEEVEGIEQQSGYSSTPKKPRVVWTPELHSKFLEAVDKLGLDKAVPKKILEIMNDPRLKRENVASHLQKYRLYVKRSTKCKANMIEPVGNNDSAYRGTPNGVVAVQNVGLVGQHSVNAYRSHPFGLSVPSETTPWGQSDNSISTQNHHPHHMFHQMPMPLQYCNMNLAPLTDGTTDFSKLHIDAGRYRGGFGNNVDSRHNQDTSGDMRGIMLLNPAAQVFVNQPNDGESFLDSAFHTLPNIKTTYLLSQTQPVSHDTSDNDLHQQTFFRGDSSGVIANGLSYEGHEFHTNDEVTDSDLDNALWQPGHAN